jgi:hypothetical protein
VRATRRDLIVERCFALLTHTVEEELTDRSN